MIAPPVVDGSTNGQDSGPFASDAPMLLKRHFDQLHIESGIAVDVIRELQEAAWRSLWAWLLLPAPAPDAGHDDASPQRREPKETTHDQP